MKNFFIRYPLVPFLFLGLILNSYLVLNEGYKYCQIDYCGNVVSKNISSGRCSTYYLLVNFDNIGEQDIVVAPTTHASYSVGDPYCLKSDFSILFGRSGTAYYPEDPQFKILNNFTLIIIHAMFVVVLTLLAVCLSGFAIYRLNQTMSEALKRKN